MKYLFAILLLFVPLLSAIAGNNEKHLFILSGQSNMARLDPEISFNPTVEAEFGKENVTVVKDAEGGGPIRRWYKKWKPAEGYDENETGYPIEREGRPNGGLYERLMAKVKEATVGKEFATVTFVWMQGERDARESHGAVYIASLEGLYAQLAADLEREDINFVLGRLSDYDMPNKQAPHWTFVRDALVTVAEAHPRTEWVNTDDLNDGIDRDGKEVINDLHYSVEGYRVFGERLAEKSIKLIKNDINW